MKIYLQINYSWHTLPGWSLGGSCSECRCLGVPCFLTRIAPEQFSPCIRSFSRQGKLDEEFDTWVVFRDLPNQFDGLGWCLSLDDGTLFGLLCLVDFVLGSLSLLLGHLFSFIEDNLPSIASKYSFPKVRSVMARLSMMILKWEALSPRRAFILSETWSLWLRSWAAENWATTVLRISLVMAGRTFC